MVIFDKLSRMKPEKYDPPGGTNTLMDLGMKLLLLIRTARFPRIRKNLTPVHRFVSWNSQRN